MTSIKIAAGARPCRAARRLWLHDHDSGSPARAGAEPDAGTHPRAGHDDQGRPGEALTLLGSGLNPTPRHHRSKVKVTLKGTQGPIKGFDIPPTASSSAS